MNDLKLNGNPCCRFCGANLEKTFVDLGMSPLCETYIAPSNLDKMEPFYPLHVYVCHQCFLVQLREYVNPKEIFSEYAYFSSFADSWVQHAKTYAEMMINRLNLDHRSLVVEVASNDGYLLQHFLGRGIRVLGIEPAANVAAAAQEKRVPTIVEFFGKCTAQNLLREYGPARLLIGNNVLAQVPDLNDFVAGIKILLAEDGVITMEFPHLHRLMEGNQFDTIYHEHFSYFSFITAEKIFRAHGIELFDVDELTTHGGSLRIYGKHCGTTFSPASEKVNEIRDQELAAGFTKLQHYSTFAAKVEETKRQLLEFLIGVKRAGKSIVGYGAPGKGNTLLNYCGIRTDFITYTVDKNPYKQGKFLPGTHIPIYHPDKIRETKPDYLLILPWNFKDEIMDQLAFIRDWGAQFVVPIPQVKVYP
jgi:hypothetical protein